jgi:hypothetical protein
MFDAHRLPEFYCIERSVQKEQMQRILEKIQMM